MLKIKKGDNVKVMRGKDAGKEGEVLKIVKSTTSFKVLVKGVNIVKKSQKPNAQLGIAGGMTEMEKPVDILQMLIEASTDKGMVILDPFMGTGSTIEACIRTERNYIGIEINKEFYQHTENRISSLCGGLFSNSFSTESSIETE